MIVHIVVPLLRHSLSPDKIAEHMNWMLDSDHDIVRLVTVSDDEGHVEVWSVND